METLRRVEIYAHAIIQVQLLSSGNTNITTNFNKLQRIEVGNKLTHRPSQNTNETRNQKSKEVEMLLPTLAYQRKFYSLIISNFTILKIEFKVAITIETVTKLSISSKVLVFYRYSKSIRFKVTATVFTIF